MKSKIFILACTFFSMSLFASCNFGEKKPDLRLVDLIETIPIQNDSILSNIQTKIDDGLLKTFINSDTEYLDSLKDDLNEVNAPIAKYWQAYIDYNKVIYYLSSNLKEECETTIDDAIDDLENEPKSSENYALLGTLQNFSISFKSPLTAGIIGANAKENFEKALELEPKNLRAYLGLVLLDFYTPEEYGGKKQTEKLARKALELPNQPLESNFLPSWGRNVVYETLVKHLINTGKKEEAKKVFKEAIEIYPNDYALNSLAKKMI